MDLPTKFRVFRLGRTSTSKPYEFREYIATLAEGTKTGYISLKSLPRYVPLPTGKKNPDGSDEIRPVFIPARFIGYAPTTSVSFSPSRERYEIPAR